MTKGDIPTGRAAIGAGRLLPYLWREVTRGVSSARHGSDIIIYINESVGGEVAMSRIALYGGVN